MSRVSSVMQVVEAVTRGRCVAVRSAEEEHRAEVLRSTRRHLAALGWRCIEINPAPGLQSAPFLPFEQAGLALEVARGRGVSDVLTTLAVEVAGERTVLLVHDHHLLDPVTRGILHAVRQRTTVPLVLGRPSGSGPGADVPVGTRFVQVAAPTLEELAQDLTNHLGTPMPPAVLGRLHAYVGGRSGLARAMVEDGSLVWRSATDPDDADGAVTLTPSGAEGLLDEMLHELEDEERHALDTLALLGPVPVSDIDSRVRPVVLEALERRGLLEQVGVARDRLLVRPPILADHLRAQVSPLRRRVLLGAEEVPAPAHPGLLEAREEMVRLVVASEEHRAHQARAHWRAGRTTDAAVALLEVLDATASDREVHAVLERSSSSEGTRRATARWHALRWLHQLVVHGDRRGAVDGLRSAAKEVSLDGGYLEACAVLLDDGSPEGRRDALRQITLGAVHAPWVAQRLALTTARLELQLLDPDAAVRALAAVRPGLEEELRCEWSVLSGVAAVLQGRAAHATAMLDQATRAAATVADRRQIEEVVSARALVCLLGVADPDLPALIGVATHLGLGPGESPLAVVHRLAARWAGDAGLGCDLRRVSRPDHPGGGQGGGRLGALVAALTAGTESPARMLEGLEGVERASDVPVVALHARGARALVTDDAEELAAVAGSFQELGLEAAAARARHAVHLEGVARGSADGADLGWVHTLDDRRRPSLTDRESEIARLVAAGYSNRRIADDLVLSVRTVETHVMRIMRKGGLESRAQVAGFLAGVSAAS